MVTKNWSLPTRYLHLGMVLTISAQLFISLFMVAPDHKGGAIGKLAFEFHEIIGLIALAIILSHWIWSLLNSTGGGLKHLFPWFGEARVDVFNDVKALIKGKLPEGGNRGGLPGLIHGLGLISVSAMAITGGILFIIFPESGEPGYFAELFAETHEELATLVWTYWIGHGGIAIIHHLQGSDIVKKMFSFGKKINPTSDSTKKLSYSKFAQSE